MQKPIVIYTRSGCGYCSRAKGLLQTRGLQFQEIDASSQAVRTELENRTHSYTVPQIFIGDDHVGGCDDLHALDRRGGLMTKAEA